MGRTWMEDGKRRQAGPLVGLHRLYTCPPGRSAVVSHLRDSCVLLRAGALASRREHVIVIGKVAATT
jgi:hypothetical protein